MTYHQGPRIALVAALAAAVVACVAAPAAADDPPAPSWPYSPPTEQGQPIVQARLINNNTQVELVDLANGRTIIGQGTNVTLWDDQSTRTAVPPTLELRPQPTGFDLVYTFTNDTAAAKPMGRLRMGSMILGERATWQDFTSLGEDRPSSADTWNLISRNYPASWYSPVAVLRNADYAVGVSLLYPMMEYKHDVRMLISNNGIPGRGREGWEAIFQLQNFGGEGSYDKLGYQRDLQPGETRTYILAVRVSRNQSDWLRTLLPYRDFFLRFYGGVRYARNTEPVIGFTTGITSYITDTNPYGFGSWRPDLNGWNTFTTGMRTLPGWKNVMIWKPTGHYKVNPRGNMPFRFTSQWLADPELATALDPDVGFPSIVSAGKNLGFWWGHAASVSYSWDSSRMDPLDPDNPEHVRLANAELDLAVQAGATMIGLDTFHPWSDAPWNLTRWLQMMRARHPQVRFVAEPISFDVLHSLAPTFMQGFLSGGNPQTLEDLYPLKQPHMLANFILPGNEIWTSFMYGPHEHFLRITPTDQMVNDDIARYAALGFTPIMFPPITVNLQNRADQRAAEAWYQVVPGDLLASYRWNRNYVNSSIVRRADGSMAIIEAASPSAPDAPTPPPQPAPPPAPPAPPGGEEPGGGGMVMGSAPDAARHATKAAKRSGASEPEAAPAAATSLAEATVDRVGSMQSPDFTAAGGKGRVDTQVRSSGARKHGTRIGTAAPTQRVQDAPSSGAGGHAPVGGARRAAGPISVMPSSIPGMRQRGAPGPVPVASSAPPPIEQAITLNAVRAAILRAQKARPVAGATSVIQVER